MIEINNLNKTYHIKGNEVEAIKDVSLRINDGEIFGIIGYSGAGKSSLIRCINLLEKPDNGEIIINGTKIAWNEKKTNSKTNEEIIKGIHLSENKLRPVRKKIGMIFQHFNLLDRATVFDNVAFPLKYSHLNRVKIKEKVLSLLDLVGLSDKINSYPKELSGGQKQRVAIARALANDPDILLSDEATSALDPNVTESILELLAELNKKLNITIVIITHEMSVIKSIANRVAVMENGRVVEIGDVYDIFSNPKENITKRFIASQNSLTKVDKLISDESELVKPKTNGILVKLQYENNCTKEALISEISKLFNVDVNICLANIDVITQKPLGQIIVVINGEINNVKESITYLKDKGVKVTDLLNGGDL